MNIDNKTRCSQRKGVSAWPAEATSEITASRKESL